MASGANLCLYEPPYGLGGLNFLSSVLPVRFPFPRPYMVCYAIPMPKTRKRPQSPKSAAQRSSSPVALSAHLRSGSGVHAGQGEYRRKDKYPARYEY